MKDERLLILLGGMERILFIGIKSLLMKPYTIEELATLLRKTIDT